jgi:hypothetical protein
LTTRDIEDLGSAVVVKVQDTKITNGDHSPFWESFRGKFAESTSDRLNSIVDFTNIIETSSTNNKGNRNY